MTDEIEELDRRIQRAIDRVPDRLSTPAGEALRREWVGIFGRCINATLEPARMFSSLRIHLHLLTDPWLFRCQSAWLVLDHPQAAEEFAWAFKRRVYVHACPRWWSLHENRHPRLIVVADKGKTAPLADMCMALTGDGFHGPFEAPPTWASAVPLSGVFQSLVRVRHPVVDEWMAHH